jgi:hypothetical protein
MGIGQKHAEFYLYQAIKLSLIGYYQLWVSKNGKGIGFVYNPYFGM